MLYAVSILEHIPLTHFCLQEELPALLTTYERRGHFDEVLSLLETGLSLERAHVRISAIRPIFFADIVG